MPARGRYVSRVFAGVEDQVMTRVEAEAFLVAIAMGYLFGSNPRPGPLEQSGPDEEQRDGTMGVEREKYSNGKENKVKKGMHSRMEKANKKPHDQKTGEWFKRTRVQGRRRCKVRV